MPPIRPKQPHLRTIDPSAAPSSTPQRTVIALSLLGQLSQVDGLVPRLGVHGDRPRSNTPHESVGQASDPPHRWCAGGAGGVATHPSPSTPAPPGGGSAASPPTDPFRPAHSHAGGRRAGRGRWARGCGAKNTLTAAPRWTVLCLVASSCYYLVNRKIQQKRSAQPPPPIPAARRPHSRSGLTRRRTRAPLSEGAAAGVLRARQQPARQFVPPPKRPGWGVAAPQTGGATRAARCQLAGR